MSKREILFRGKHKHMFPGNKHLDGVWVEGYLSDENYINAICEDEYGDKYTSEKLIDPETVCQYTGVADKSGRRYEGDIFQASDGDYIQRYVIRWDDDALEWSAQCISNLEGTLPLCEFKVGEIDVIGNIFDNPELLN